MISDHVLVWVFVFLSATHMAHGIGEWFEWWGNPAEPHFSHGSAALVWIALAVLYNRTS
jgi:hypothetical protein